MSYYTILSERYSDIRTGRRMLTLYHVGAPNIEKWDLNHVGTGEGSIRPMGDGIYFASERKVALRYAKYQKEPWLYTVQVPADEIYHSLTGKPEHLRDRIVQHSKDIPGWDPSVNKILNKKGPKFLSSLGVSGARKNLTNGYEVCIYDPNAIRTVSAKPL